MKSFPELTGSIVRLFDECAVVGQLLHEKGWAEGNGGNLSIRITDFISNKWLKSASSEKRIEYDLEAKYQNLSNECFLLKGSGKRMRNIGANPENTLCMGIINEDKLNIFWPIRCDFKPTSELHSHLILHNFLISERPNQKAVLHTHPTELIALSFLQKYSTAKSISSLLSKYNPSVPIFAPNGVGYIDFKIPSSKELANKTLEQIKRNDLVIWAKHGVICSGSDLNSCFDLIDIVNKSAIQYFLLRDEDHKPISDENIVKIKKSFRSFFNTSK